MKNLILTFFVLTFFVNSSSAQTDESPDFRKAKWGMSPAQVKSSETEELIRQDESTLAYKAKILGLDAFIIYIFVNDKLVRARYAFDQKHSNKNEFLSDYTSVNNAISDKYGSPKTDKANWSNNLYKSDPSSWGMAVSAGHLSKFATWETDETSIITGLSGDNFEVSLITEYSSKALANLEKEKQKKKNQSDF